MATDKSIATAITLLGEAFRQKVSDATMEAYKIGVGDLSNSDLARATDIALHTCKFFPSPAELREFVGQKHESVAQKAWLAVDRAAYIGSYRHVDFDDPLINAAIRSLGGWAQILTGTGDNWAVWTRKDFVAAYESFSRGGVSADACRPLDGLSQGEVRDRALCDNVIPTKIGVDYALPKVSQVAALERETITKATDSTLERVRMGAVRKMRKLDPPKQYADTPQTIPETIGQ